MIEKNQKILIKKKLTFNLSNKDKINILKIKSLHYNFSLNKQKKWFDENINKNDIHYLVYYKKKLIGYNCLRKLKIIKINTKSINKIILFDTLVFNPQFRGKGFSKKLLIENYKFLDKRATIGLLYCKKNMLRYYKKFNWLKINKKQVTFLKIKKKFLFPMIKIKKKNNLNKLIFNVDTK